MKLYPVKLVTIIAESFAREPLVHLLDEVGAHGYTLFPVEGKGAQGMREGGMGEYANIQLEVILPEDQATHLLERLEQVYFPRYTMIAFESDVRVLRQGKF